MREGTSASSRRKNTQTVADIRSVIYHADLSLSDDWVLSLKRLEARFDEDQLWRFDFKKTWLPPNSLFPHLQRLTDKPALLRAVIMVVQEYLNRCKNSKSRTDRAKSVLQVTLLTIEYLWLSDIVELSSALPANFESIPEKLAQGGWFNALDILERAGGLEISVLEGLLRPASMAESLAGSYATQKDIQEAIGTNCHNVISLLRKRGLARSGKPSHTNEAGPESRASARTIVNSLTTINFLFDIGPEWGVSFPPFKKPDQIGRKVGKPESRTKNIPVDVAARLLKEATSWIYEYGPVVAELLEDVTDEVVACRAVTRKWMGRRIKAFFDASQKRSAASAVLPFPIEFLDFGRQVPKGKHSLRQALLCTMSACFVVIATMNARRKDEILHRKFGLRNGDFRVLSASIELFEADFYIEKTYRRRIPFYVNRLTADAIQLLERIETSFHRIDINVPAEGVARGVSAERALFAYRRFSLMKGVGKERKWYDFTAYGHDSDALQFLSLATSGARKVPVAAHMFRRMYALVFYYQYENADLQSLMHQLGHFDLASTLVYITDPSSRPEIESIKAVMDITSTEIQRARSEHIESLQEELSVVGDEKQIEDIFAIIAGHNFSGGYAKYIRRIHSRLANIVRFNVAGDEGEAVVAAVKQRGHFPRPMRHGQCMAGRTLSIKSARCVSEHGNELQREKAAVSTCSNCIFHLTSPAYLKNVEEDIEVMEKSLLSIPPGSVFYESSMEELKNLRRATDLLRVRLSKNAASIRE
jgi:hypothetical protein